MLDMGATVGVGAALRAGYEYALAGGYDVAVVMAGNNKDAPEEIPRLLDPIADDEAGDGIDSDCDGMDPSPAGDDGDDGNGNGCSASVSDAPASGGLLLVVFGVLSRRARRRG